MSHIVVHPRILMVDNDKRAIEALTALLSKALPTPCQTHASLEASHVNRLTNQSSNKR